MTSRGEENGFGANSPLIELNAAFFKYLAKEHYHNVAQLSKFVNLIVLFLPFLILQ